MFVLNECILRYGVRPKGIVHVGAHHAEEMDKYLALHPDIIVWIEGDPKHIPVIEKAISTRTHLPTRQIVIEALITDSDNVNVDFHRFSNDGHSSSIFHGTELLQTTWPDVSETGETLNLKSWRLETVLTKHGISADQIDVLVVDLQGAELLALCGAGAFLEQIYFLEVEVSTSKFYSGGVLAPQLDAFLDLRGFQRMTGSVLHGSAVYHKRISRLTKFETEDLALNKPATQSSISPYSKGRINEDARGANSSFIAEDFGFCTERELNPWWQVDLEEVFLIDSIYLLNRKFAVERLTFFTLLKSNDGFHWEELYKKTDRILLENGYDLPIALPIQPGKHLARYLRLRLDAEEYLHFRKIYVFGQKQS